MTKKSIGERRKEHERHAKGETNRIFYHAMRKHGLIFTWEILEEGLSKKEAEEKEIYYIALLNSTDRNFGYNQAKGEYLEIS
jgi:hypothetical protein